MLTNDLQITIASHSTLLALFSSLFIFTDWAIYGGPSQLPDVSHEPALRDDVAH